MIDPPIKLTDIGAKDTPLATAKKDAEVLVKQDKMKPGPGTPPIAKQEQLKLWAKFINHQYASWSALFELVTGYKPPKMKEVAAIISGH